MPRKQFLLDLGYAQSNHNAPNICDLVRGDEDGQIEFLFNAPALCAPIRFSAFITDVGDYPARHNFYLYTEDDVPKYVSDHISSLEGSFTGKSITGLLQSVSTSLIAFLAGHSESEMESEVEYDDDEDVYNHNDFIGGPIPFHSASQDGTSETHLRLKKDLRTTKKAGFRVTCYGGLHSTSPAIVSISCRIPHLAISPEALKAWHLPPNEYLILLLRFPRGYKSLEQFLDLDSTKISQYFEVRIGTSTKYKVSPDTAKDAFNLQILESATDNGEFKNTFISKPLTELITQRLVPLIRSRRSDPGATWDDAEHEFIKLEDQGHSDEATDLCPSSVNESSGGFSNVALMSGDHLGASGTSLPLIAMEFFLRHFVRCTEFCLVCSRKLESLEALKPYVCDRPLCLYQYMNLGFGPSIEHEILSQPMVVDLLLSFCFKSAAGNGRSSFPNGLSLTMPANFEALLGKPSYSGERAIIAEIDLAKQEMRCTGSPSNPFKLGQWVISRKAESTDDWMSFRITELDYYPTVKFSEPVRMATSSWQVVPKHKAAATNSKDEEQELQDPISTQEIWPFTVNFDELLTDDRKQLAIQFLLNTLPTVAEMSAFITADRQSKLMNWQDRISPSALGVLRWVIASNRACIIYIDGTDASEERVRGMSKWTQFRFAMGSPDKEYKFQSAVRQTSQRLGVVKYPVMFAWHGSAIQNWHSIIRVGLNFDKVINGRAYGDGIYHSLFHSTSLQYTGHRGNPVLSQWAQSTLQPATAMSLNEIVNAPGEFVSTSPHLVINKLDWVQTRYLFVQCAPSAGKEPYTDACPTNPRPQDPHYTPTGQTGTALVIPSKLSNSVPSKRKTKKWSINKKLTNGARDESLSIEDVTDGIDDESDVTDDEDRQLLAEEIIELSDDESVKDSAIDVFAGCSFRPGSLDYSTLPKMPHPSFATSSTTKRLQKDFQELLRLQDSTPAKELGWYIKSDELDSVYQWIVELHSFDQFDATLPLVGDMKQAGVDSIVLELRFNGSYPHTPPFCRVVRPRFVPFAQKAGGNVTMGGAMCMELLTNDGWMMNSIESVLLQIRMAIASTDPYPARLDLRAAGRGRMIVQDYGVKEATDAYLRACMNHGWTPPADFSNIR